MNLKGTSWHNASLKSSEMIRIVFSDVDFSGADLKNARFTESFMNSLNFSGADLRGAVIEKTAFENCDFSEANLEGIKYDDIALQFFSISNLQGAKMSMDLQKDLEKLRSAQIPQTS